MYKWWRSRRSLLLLLVVLLPSWLLFGYYTASAPMGGGPAPRPPQQLLRTAPAACRPAALARADIDTISQFSTFDFQPYWMKSREYWDTNFENRYKQKKQEWPKLPLKVIVVPHSHNDPGWLKTFESYYHYQTRNILNNMADKLTLFKNMTFIWSEVSFFSQWWQSAHPNKKRLVKRLLEEGRLEITTGGWVMTDEANSHIFAMVDQLIQGHQWVKNKLGVSPQSGWSIDPFGHGATVPYLLSASGLELGTVIQRIHYAWKQWLAEHEAGDFMWRQGWDTRGRHDFLVHNQPFDIYSIKHSCGPHPQVCLNFDFRKIAGEYTEYSLRAVAIDLENVKQKAELLLEQYGRTGSLFPHNVVLMPVGDDFRYDHDIEWLQQYTNYKRLFDYINERKNIYNAEIVFGTPADYFKEIRNRMRDFKTLRGDFYVYSDIFSEGRPAYWSGYFTTRPYWKILDRELEAELRSAEILYTLSLNKVRKMGFNGTLKILERDYEKLQSARQNLALFQHHDAITGTSKAFVMHDYALKMFEAIQECISVQGYALQTLVTKPEGFDHFPASTRFILPDTDRDRYETLPYKVPLTIKRDRPRRLIVFNSLAQARYDIIRVRVRSPEVRVFDSSSNLIISQVNPVWNFSEPKLPQESQQELKMTDELYEVMFSVLLPPLSVSTFRLEFYPGKEGRATVYCKSCAKSNLFDIKNIQLGDIQLENHKIKLLVDGRTGFLKSVMDKETGHTTQCAIEFAAYSSAQFHSGAYLFMPDPNARDIERDILEEYNNQRMVIATGPIASTLTVAYGNLLAHTIQIYHGQTPLSQGIFIENTIDFESPPKNRETELFMRFVSDLNNGDPPVFFTDQNGFQTQKRVKVERIGIEGNYFPVTTHTYIQDEEKRLTLLVNHALGAAAWQPGWLEVMLDRRTLYDDSRGMGEGVVDNKKTLSKFWLLLEDSTKETGYSKPSLLANYLSLGLMYPPNVFVLESANDEATSKTTENNLYDIVPLLNRDFPCDVHLLNFRTLQDKSFDHFPSNSALLVLHKQGYTCSIAANMKECIPSSPEQAIREGTTFSSLKTLVSQTYLTGLSEIKKFTSLAEATLRDMELITLNITFIN
ncbi:unnamed protein product [Nezara viridula]|uniref:Alpha-mannosidase n=1 Tax=Nezara viridula TaxID=85310 RepID=A0A9P0EF50_NEZVI|nr:unnamed protein product [Nezara viridula]